MELHSYMSSLKPYWKLLVIAPIAAAMLALAATYLFTTYSAKATVQVFALDADPRTTNLRGENGQAAVPIDSSNTAQIVTEGAIQQITSRDNATKIVQELNLDAPQSIDNPIDWFKSTGRKTKRVLWDIARYGTYRTKPRFDAAVDAVQGSLTATEVKNSYVIEVTAKGSNPIVARDIANTAVQKYIETARQQRGSSLAARREFLTNQTLVDLGRVNEIRLQLTNYRQHEDFVSGAAQISQQVTSTADIDAQIREADASIGDTRARLAVVDEQVAQVPTETSSRTSGNGVDTTVTSPNPAYESLQSTRLSIQRELASLEARRSALASALEAKKSDTGDLVTRDSQVAALQLEMDLASSALTTHQAALTSARLEESQPADQFQIVESAIAPLYPASPLKYMWVTAAVILALALAVMLAFVLDYYNMGLRGPQQAADLLGAPTLSVVGARRASNGVFIPKPREVIQ